MRRESRRVSDRLLQRLGLQADLLATCAAGRPGRARQPGLAVGQLHRNISWHSASPESRTSKEIVPLRVMINPRPAQRRGAIFRFRRACDPARRERWLGAGTRTHRAYFVCATGSHPRTAACPLRTISGSLAVDPERPSRDRRSASGGGATGRPFRAASGCPDRAQRGSRCLCRAALSRATSANAKRGSPPPKCSSPRGRPIRKPWASRIRDRRLPHWCGGGEARACSRIGYGKWATTGELPLPIADRK